MHAIEFAKLDGITLDISDIHSEGVLVDSQNFRGITTKEMITRAGITEFQDFGSLPINGIFIFTSSNGLQTSYVIHGADIYAQ